MPAFFRYAGVFCAAVPTGLSAEYCWAPAGITSASMKIAAHRRMLIDYSDCHCNSHDVSLTIRSERNASMQKSYNGLPLPDGGEAIQYADGKYHVPDHPIIPFIEGDGTGRDIWRASQRVFDAAVEKAYGGRRSVKWFEIFAGEKAFSQFSTWLPDDSVAAARDLRGSIKGPLTTPGGGGIRSLNVALRQLLDLYACVRPVKYYQGVPSPVKHPEKLDVVIFRENTEDVYAGIEFKEGSKDA